MPKLTLMGPRWVLAPAAALVAVLWCAPAQAVVGGSEVPMAEHPYQVALVVAGTDAAADPPSGQYCGGSIRDSLHVITAAHCVFDTDGSGQPADADQIDVLAGTADLRDEGAGQRVHVSAISFEPNYDAHALTNDAAVLTLAAPLQLSSTIQPTSIIGDADWQALQTGDDVFVTGWGAASYGGPSFYTLHGASVDYYTANDCENDPSFIVDLQAGQMCASVPGQRDACQGDSGGPLVRLNAAAPTADDRLVGIVSSGVGCANATFPGIYTETAYPEIKTFLLQPNPPPAPALRSTPTLNGTAAIGQQLTCAPGDWSGSPVFTYQFVRSVGGADVGVAASGATPAYTVAAQDAGTTLRCDVTATNSGGTAVAKSAATGVIAAPVSAPTPTPIQQQPQTSLDLYAPVARITRVRCTVTRCTLTVSVRDAGFSAGIKTVRATVRSTYRSSCRRNGRTVACTKHRTSKPSVKALSATHFQVVASKLPVGKQLFTLVAVDRAGHRQALPTRKTVTTKKPARKTARR
jgi:hypothetical protein